MHLKLLESLLVYIYIYIQYEPGNSDIEFDIKVGGKLVLRSFIEANFIIHCYVKEF